jgi:uncharacterized protein (TIGR02145 family)
MPSKKNHISFCRLFARLALILILMLWIASLFTCTKDEPRLMKVLSDRTEDESFTTVIIYITVVDIGEGIDQYGYCWSTETDNPTIENCDTSTSLGPLGKPEQYSDTISNLSPNSKYYIKAYLKKGSVIVYSNSLPFTTLMPTEPVVKTDSVTNITKDSCKCWGDVISEGGAPVTERGVCWDTSSMPDLKNSHITNGSGTGRFSTSVKELASNTSYYIRAYATNSKGTAYGNQLSFRTIDIPTVTTTSVTSNTITTAQCGGNVTSDGGATVTARGVCWSTSQNPTIADSKTKDGSGTGSFTSNLSGLVSSTTYFVRAYATNSQGTAYGNQVSFTAGQTITSPNVTTSSVTSITRTTAQCGGNVTSDGGATVTARGVCWSKSHNPILADNITTNGSDIGSYTSDLLGLTQYTTYYVRAYATNSYGTAYGSEIEFKTLWGCGAPFLDLRDGESYRTVQFGSQCWMAENINIGTQIDGAYSQRNDGIVEKYCYGNLESNCNLYGGLYQWDEMMQYTTTESAPGICPQGWHVPSDHEWKEMEIYHGMDPTQADDFGYRGTDQGTQLKAGGTSGFEALMAGKRSEDGAFRELGNYTTFWNSSATDRTLSTTAGFDGIWRGGAEDSKYNGFSVRCIHDP